MNCPGFSPGQNIAQARQPLAGLVINVDSIAQVRRVFVDAQSGTQFTDVTDWIFLGRVHIERAGPVHVVPLGFVLAVAIENLHAIVFPVGNVNPAVFVRHDVVHDIELSGIGTRLAPGQQELSIGRIFMHARISVAVGHVNIPLRRESHVGAAIERFAALIRRGLARHPERDEEFFRRACICAPYGRRRR